MGVRTFLAAKGEGRVVQGRTDPSGLLGCARRAGRARCAGAGAQCPVGWPGPSRWERQCGGRRGPAPRLCGARRRASGLPLHASSPLRLAPLHLGGLPAPAAGRRGAPRGSGAPGLEVARARRLTPSVGERGPDRPRPRPFGATPPWWVLPRTRSAHLGLGFRLDPERGHGWGGRGSWRRTRSEDWARGRESESSARSRPAFLSSGEWRRWRRRGQARERGRVPCGGVG